MKYVAGFARFWYDFFVGDSVTLAMGGVTALVLAAVLVGAGAGALVQVLLPLAVVGALAISLRASNV